MKSLNRWMHILLVSSTSLIAVGCSSPTPAVIPTERPVVDTRVPAPTSLPTEIPASPTPEVTFGWSSHSSTGSELSFRHPGEWYGPAKLPFGEGLYVKDPDRDIGIILQYALSGNPTQMLAAWGTTKIDIIGVLTFTPETAAEGEPITISRVEAQTRIAEGGGLTAQSVFVARPGDVLQVMWYAPTEEWESLQPTFADVIESIDMWRKATH
jgi:hypothetical protein